MSQLLLDARRLSAFYGQTQALFELDLSVISGGITTLLGANGAGKTTTLRALCGMIRATGEIEFLDDCKFPLNLQRGALVLHAIAMDHAFARPIAQKVHLRLLIWSGIVGEFVAEIFQRELQARGQLRGIGDGFWKIRKKRAHLQRRFQVAFAVAGKKAAGIREHAMMAQACEDIQNFALRGQRVTNAIGG